MCKFNWLKYSLHFFTIKCSILNHCWTPGQQCPCCPTGCCRLRHPSQGGSCTYSRVPSAAFRIFTHFATSILQVFIWCLLLLTRRCQAMTTMSWLPPGQQKVQGRELASLVRLIMISETLTERKNAYCVSKEKQACEWHIKSVTVLLKMGWELCVSFENVS